MNIRPATRDDVIAFTGKAPAMTMRAHVAEQDGEVLALGGVYYCAGAAIAFLEMNERMRSHRKSLMRGAKLVMAKVAEMTVPVHAVCSRREPTAPAFLARLGFVPVRESELGDVYVWGRHASV